MTPQEVKKWYDGYPALLLIHCCHCGNLEIDKDDDLKTYQAFVSQSYLALKVCPQCNEEATFIKFIGQC